MKGRGESDQRRHGRGERPEDQHEERADHKLTDSPRREPAVSVRTELSAIALRLSAMPSRRARCSRRDLVQIFEFVGDFLAAATFHFSSRSPPRRVRTLTVIGISGGKSGDRFGGFLSRRLALISRMVSPTCRPARSASLPAVTASTVMGPSKFREADKACIGHRVLMPTTAQADAAEKIVPGNFFGASNIFREEPAQVDVADRLGGFANSFGIVEEASLFRVVLIHPLQDFAQRSLAVAGFAHGQIEHDRPAVRLCCNKKCCGRDGDSRHSLPARHQGWSLPPTGSGAPDAARVR